MKPEELKAIEKRAEKATPGPWEIDKGHLWRAGSCQQIIATEQCNPTDMDFITHAREDIPALLTEVKRLQAELDELTGYRIKMPAVPHKLEEPMKVGNITFAADTTVWNCPRCGTSVTRVYKYCSECGQALGYD